MHEILESLNSGVDALGSMVITPDGIMVCAALNQDFEEDSMAAFAASLLLSIKRSLQALEAKSSMKSCTLCASNGRVMFFDMETSYLVLVVDLGTALDANAGPIQEAIQRISTRRIA